MPSTALERSTVRLMRCRVSWMRDCAVSSSLTFCMVKRSHGGIAIGMHATADRHSGERQKRPSQVFQCRHDSTPFLAHSVEPRSRQGLQVFLRSWQVMQSPLSLEKGFPLRCRCWRAAQASCLAHAL